MKTIIAVAIASGLIADEITYVGHNYHICRLGDKFGLHDSRKRKMELGFICSSIDHFPNTTHLWVECEGKVGVFDTELRRMVVPVDFTLVCHTSLPGEFLARKESQKLRVATETRFKAGSVQA